MIDEDLCWFISCKLSIYLHEKCFKIVLINFTFHYFGLIFSYKQSL